MSIESWRKEFYPVDASDVPEPQALDHSIRKWEGLKKANLKKHQVVQDGHGLHCLDECFYVDSDSCALCIHYDDGPNKGCHGCPIFNVRGMRCDVVEGSGLSPFDAFIDNHNAIPMLNLLKKAKNATEQKGGGDG